MNIATAMLLAWCIDRHWDDRFDAEINPDPIDHAIVEAVIVEAERLYPDLSNRLVW